MAAKKASREKGEPSSQVTELRLIANLLGLLATKEMGEADRVAMLNAAGFRNAEIGRLLGKTENNIKVTLFLHKKRKKKRN